jgi:predicted ATP-grasp superfamily ATP-dependent carboligase
MRVFAYEMVTAGGLKPPSGGDSDAATAATGSLLVEGRAMIEALAADLSNCPGIEVDLLWAARLTAPQLSGVRVHPVAGAAEESALFDRLAREADATIVIAPECGGQLTARCRRVLAAGGQLLGPSVELVELASDKHDIALHLAAAGVHVPLGVCLAEGEALPCDAQYPAVLKPRDGAGSQAIQLIADADGAARVGRVTRASRLETYCPGRAASIALLCGRGLTFPLPPCWQNLSADGSFTYLGGGTIDDPQLRARATRLAEQVLDALPAPQGYLGLDLILGDDPHGQDDRVIELNPRLTTSYIGLRRALDINLAGAWINIVAGHGSSLPVAFQPVEFDVAGHVWSKTPARRAGENSCG